MNRTLRIRGLVDRVRRTNAPRRPMEGGRAVGVEARCWYLMARSTWVRLGSLSTRSSAVLIESLRGSPSTYSMAMNGMPSSSPTSNTVQMPGCFNRDAVRPARAVREQTCAW